MSIGAIRRVMALGAITLLLSSLTSCRQSEREAELDEVPTNANTWARHTVVLLQSGLGGERPIPSIYLPDGRESAYDVSAAVVALVLSGERLTADQVGAFLRVASRSWSPRDRAWKSGAVPSSATAGMVLTALDVLGDQSADQLSHFGGEAARLRALADASSPDRHPRVPQASDRALADIERTLARRPMITPELAAQLRSLSRPDSSMAAAKRPVVLDQVARLLEADQIVPHPVAFASVAQTLNDWDVDFELSTQARNFLNEILLYGATRSVVTRDGHAFADVVTTLRLLEAPVQEPDVATYFQDIDDSSSDIALRLAFEAPVPHDLVEREAKSLRGSDLNPDHAVLLAQAAVAEAWSCGPELERVLRRSLDLIQAGAADLTELSSSRVAQAWWVAAAAVRCDIGPRAMSLKSELTELMTARIDFLMSSDGVDARERVLSLSALIEAGCSTAASKPDVDGQLLLEHALSVTNPHGGAGYRSDQVDPFVTESVSRLLSFAAHGCDPT